MIPSSATPAWKDDDRATVDFFTHMVAANGVGPLALDWGSARSQALRFSRLARIADLQGATLLDVGCGQGDLLAWFRRREIRVDYAGLDITPSMIEACRRRFPEVPFQVGNVVDLNDVAPGQWDYLFACGIFYRRTVRPAEYLQTAVAQMFAHCRKGLAFNSLSAWSDVRDADEFYADPTAVLDFCRSLTNRVVLDHGYHDRDFTIHLYK
jgi:SAM-dependent methyltransferase